MASQVDICNMALSDVGSNSINAIADGSNEADECSIYWDQYVKEVLAEHTWNFAKKWVSLAEISGYSMIDTEYSYAFQLPSDYIRMSKMEKKGTQYEVREDTLLVNLDTCKIEYIFLVDDAQKFSTAFVSALVSRLRSSLASKLARKGVKSVDWYSSYLMIDLPRAKRKDALEGSPSEENRLRHTDENETWLTARKT